MYCILRVYYYFFFTNTAYVQLRFPNMLTRQKIHIATMCNCQFLCLFQELNLCLPVCQTLEKLLTFHHGGRWSCHKPVPSLLPSTLETSKIQVKFIFSILTAMCFNEVVRKRPKQITPGREFDILIISFICLFTYFDP